VGGAIAGARGAIGGGRAPKRLVALHRALIGEEGAIAPPAWWLGRICEEFGVPLVEGGAIDQPVTVALEILEYRNYAAALRDIDRAAEGDGAELEEGPMHQTVHEVEREIGRGDLARMRERMGRAAVQ
jgi:hypothetical protein